MSVNAVILGGGGYLGNVVVQALSQSGKLRGITVIDCDMWGDMPQLPAKVILKRQNILDCDHMSLPDDSRVLWAIDIDCENFYTYPQSAHYIKDNLNVFEEYATIYGDNLRLVTDDYFGDNEDYKKFLSDKIAICEAHGCKYVKVPQLFGPSGRMRWDTLLNEMFISGFSNGVISIDDWLRRYGVCSVAVAGEYIAENMVLNDSPIGGTIRNCALSLCDFAGIMTRVFDGKVKMMLSDNMTSYEYLETEDISILPFGRYTIKKSFEYIMSSLEKDGIADMVRDCHNNSKMLYNLSAYASLSNAMKKYMG